MLYRPHLFLPPLFIWQRQIQALSTPFVPTIAVYLITSDTCFIDPTCSYHQFIWQRQIQSLSTPLVPTIIVYLTTSDTCFIEPTCSCCHCLFDNVRCMFYRTHLFLLSPSICLIDPVCFYCHCLFDNVRYMLDRTHLFLLSLSISQRQIHVSSNPLVSAVTVYLTTSDTPYRSTCLGFIVCFDNLRYKNDVFDKIGYNKKMRWYGTGTGGYRCKLCHPTNCTKVRKKKERHLHWRILWSPSVVQYMWKQVPLEPLCES